MSPDLDTDPALLLALALVLGLVAAVLWMHEHRSAVARFRRVLARVGRTPRRAEDDNAARMGRSVHRHHRRHERRRARRQPDRARGSLALTDSEVVALARHLDRTVAASAQWTSALGLIPLLTADEKIRRAASDVLHADRLGRRA